jgi:hypothetical protein
MRPAPVRTRALPGLAGVTVAIVAVSHPTVALLSIRVLRGSAAAQRL